jgi:hypothetical protein
MVAWLLGENCAWKTPARDLLDVNHSLLAYRSAVADRRPGFLSGRFQALSLSA